MEFSVQHGRELIKPIKIETTDFKVFSEERTSQQLSYYLLTGTLAPDLKSVQTLQRGQLVGGGNQRVMKIKGLKGKQPEMRWDCSHRRRIPKVRC